MNSANSGKFSWVVFLVIIGLIFSQSLCFAEKKDAKNRPERLVLMAVEYPGVEIAKVGNDIQALDWTGVLCIFSTP